MSESHTPERDTREPDTEVPGSAEADAGSNEPFAEAADPAGDARPGHQAEENLPDLNG